MLYKFLFLGLFLNAVSFSLAELPSCEDDTAKYCLGEGADFSPEGITKCLDSNLDNLSKACSSFRAIVAGCDEELTHDGICSVDYLNGDGMPCLLQRSEPEALSVRCAKVIAENSEKPKKDMSLRGTFWKDGKRQLQDDEIETLNDDDKALYKKWWARKLKKMGKNSDVQYAIKQQKKAKHTKIIIHKAMKTALKVLKKSANPKDKMVRKAVRRVVKKLIKAHPDINFTSDDIKDITKQSVKEAKREIRQDAINAKKEL